MAPLSLSLQTSTNASRGKRVGSDGDEDALHQTTNEAAYRLVGKEDEVREAVIGNFPHADEAPSVTDVNSAAEVPATDG
jgi:hypothetical protein